MDSFDYYNKCLKLPNIHECGKDRRGRVINTDLTPLMIINFKTTTFPLFSQQITRMKNREITHESEIYFIIHM